MFCSNFKLIYRPKLRVKQINAPNMNEISVSLRKQINLFEGLRFSDHHTLLRLGLVVKAGTAHSPLGDFIINHTTYEMNVKIVFEHLIFMRSYPRPKCSSAPVNEVRAKD